MGIPGWESLILLFYGKIRLLLCSVLFYFVQFCSYFVPFSSLSSEKGVIDREVVIGEQGRNRQSSSSSFSNDWFK